MSATRGLEGVDRLVGLLEALADSGRGLRLHELATAAGLPKSTTHRLLAALADHRMVLQWEPDGAYTLGPHFLALASRFHDRFELRVVAHPLLAQLGEELDETIHMAVLVGGDVVYLDKVDSRHVLNLTSSIGGSNPAHATAVGKALLAWTYPTADALAGWAAEHAPLERRTEQTITDVASLARALEEVRERGYALESEESELGVRCLAKPLWFGGDVPRAAVSVSAPKERLPDERLATVIPAFSAAVEAAFPRS